MWESVSCDRFHQFKLRNSLGHSNYQQPKNNFRCLLSSTFFFSSSFINDLYDVVSTITTKFHSAPLFLLGDFNFPNITWNNGQPILSSSSDSQEFFGFCSTFSLCQMVTQATRITQNTSNTLDLILTNYPECASDTQYLPGISDHLIITFHLNVPFEKLPKSKKIIRDYKKANYEAINNELCEFVDEFLKDFDNRTVQSNWNMFEAEVKRLTNKHIPTRAITCNPRAPWYNNTLKRLSNRKKRMYRSAKQTPTESRSKVYTLASNAYVAALKQAKQTFLSSTLPYMLLTNVRKFWRVIHPLSDNSITLNDSSGNPVPESHCAALLNDVFVNNFSRTNDITLPALNNYNYLPMPPIIIDVTGVIGLIDSMKRHSSPGFDNISAKFLKNTSSYSSIVLTKIFQQSLNTSSLPLAWKTGKVIPLHKSGSKTSPRNYRPISLTSTCCKLLEHIIFTNLINSLESNSFFTPSQHGFRKTLYCESQLLSFTHKLHQILDRSSLADCIFLDYSKAFDKVSHRLLLHKLHILNLDCNLLKWIESFLVNRSQFVTANDHDSPLSIVQSGVPQGSVLGPLLFLIYINDLTSAVTSNIHLFADDCVIFKEITTPQDITTLQADLNNICNWCQQWRMELNISKRKFMRISRSNRCLPVYHLNNISLEATNSYKYLGVHITSNLTWNKHIKCITNQGNRFLGCLRRNFSRAPSPLLLLLYKTLLSPMLEYASAIWEPYHDNLTHSM